MRVVELSLRNYRVFEEVDLELPARVIGIFGPNGAGKSTLVEALLFACYGRARTHKDQIRTDGVLTDCAVRLVFEHGGQQYEVRRTIKGKNHQTEAELYVGDMQLASGVTEVDTEIQKLLRMDQQVFRASVFAEQKQLDAFSDVTKGKRKEMVLRLLGIRPVDDARGAARREARATKQNVERLAGALPDLAEQEAQLDEVRRVAEEAEGKAGTAAAALAEAGARAGAAAKGFEASDQIRQEVEQLSVKRTAAQDELERLETQHAELVKRIKDIRDDLKELPAVRKEHAALAGSTDRLAAARRIADSAAETSQLHAELAGLPDVDATAAVADHEAAQKDRESSQRSATKAESAHERAREELANAEEDLDRAGEADPSQPCPTCGRPLGDDFKEYVAHCRSGVREAKVNAQDASRALREAMATLKAAEARFKEAAKRGEEARRASEARGTVTAQLDKARKRFKELVEPFGGEVPDVEALEADSERAQTLVDLLAELKAEERHLSTAEDDLAKAASGLGKCRTRIEALDQEAAALAFDPEDHARLRKERDESGRLLDERRAEDRAAATAVADARQTLNRLEGALEQAQATAARVGELRDEARYLERVSLLLDGFRDHLVARIGPELSREAESIFRDLTNREYDDLRIHEDTLAIEIADGTRYFPIERFSGSEADLANLALRVAISMHLSRMSGADVGMMVLDEVLGSLDLERKDLFVQTMGRLAGRFHQLFVITHAELVKDQFPASIEVSKVGRRRSQAVMV